MPCLCLLFVASSNASSSRASPACNQCGEFASVPPWRASVQPDWPDNPSKRHKVTRPVSPHRSHTRFSSPSMKRPRLNAREEAGRRQCGQTNDKFRAPQRTARCLSQFTSSPSARSPARPPHVTGIVAAHAKVEKLGHRHFHRMAAVPYWNREIIRGSPAMNGVPDRKGSCGVRSMGCDGAAFRNLISLVSNRARFQDFP